MQSESERIRVRMSMRAPVIIARDEWTLIAAAKAHEGDFRTWYIRARENTDVSKGCIVYGWYETSWESERPAYAGYLCSREAVPATLRQVAQEIGGPNHLVNDAIADLPAERL